jgi:hypothetical protein
MASDGDLIAPDVVCLTYGTPRHHPIVLLQ